MILLFSNFKFAMKKKLRIVKDECSFDGRQIQIQQPERVSHLGVKQ